MADPVPTPQVGDYVTVRGVYAGDADRPEECTVDVFSQSTQYPVVVRRGDVSYFGPAWWPPRQDDVVISGTEPWRFYRDDNDGRMWAVTTETDPDCFTRLGGETEDAETWRGAVLVIRDGKREF